MKIRLADYVAEFLADHGVTDVFSVVGGGAMHLNDALGHNERLHVTYNHHEQACAIAAEAYARIDNRIAAVCVTTGPGGTNALTGVVGGWLDSIPMFIISGQVRYDTTARYMNRVIAEEYDDMPDGVDPEELGIPQLRAVGDQEYDIVRSVEPMTKYATMIEDPMDIRYALERGWQLANTGRPGPVWIDIPVNFQGAFIETDDLRSYYDSPEYEEDFLKLPPEVEDETIDVIIDKIKSAKRPVFHAGYGIRLSGAYETFRSVADKLQIPVVTYWNAVDLIESDNPLYVGRAGNMGDRAGNWAIQNADLILAVGTRISIRQTGYNWATWADKAEVIMVDIDRAEMLKKTIHVDMPVWADAADFLEKMDERLDAAINTGVYEELENRYGSDSTEAAASGHKAWLSTCIDWRDRYPVVTPQQLSDDNNETTANVYAFIKELSSRLPEGSLTAVSNGACCVAGHQAYEIKKDSRFVINSAIASMGYGLPAAIGTCIASGYKAYNRCNISNTEKKAELIYQPTICLEGDGSIMMNLQELQTVITNRLPIAIFLINNQGYHSIRQTQNNLFKDRCKVGIGPESNDLSFPDFGKLADAFGYKYYSAYGNAEMRDVIEAVLAELAELTELQLAGGCDGESDYTPIFCEIFTDTEQRWEPKSSTKRLEDGTLVSPPLHDLAPFLPREELEEIMRASEEYI